ncbi:hypothetical protein AK812_SmicGene41715 [Symbiodinium microadriaticum]|uniref:Right handed beta helix domain-containing protein n=1 Tax=Symbiodinium microadriaticum TaxID=2951 RepID=A0A1Q9C5D9_SYMMI|nr:hypothetical protein AK812_SmicGene41715 [Symbiodinium microadriaticum]
MQKPPPTTSRGGVWTQNFTQGPQSSASFRGCSARGKRQSAKEHRGGGLLVAKSYRQDAGSSALFETCSAKVGGGASVKDFSQEGPQSCVNFTGCRATDGGGLVAESYHQAIGTSADFENCTAERGEGGGLYTTMLDGRGSMHFRACGARAGGGLSTSELDGNGSMRFETCRAEAGGGINVRPGGRVQHGGSLEFQACNASFTGGGLYSSAGPGEPYTSEFVSPAAPETLFEDVKFGAALKAHGTS